jgi:hypothetical protein
MQHIGWRRRALFVLKVLGLVLLVACTALAATIGIARALLPATCDISEAQFDKLAMEMEYAKVKELLGCDGVLVEKQDYGQIVIEHYAWRGAAWPYARVRAEFINNTLQGTNKLWLDLKLTWSKPN